MSAPSPQAPHSPQAREQQRRNVVLFVALAAIVFAIALLPTVCAYTEQPEAFYATAAEAPRRPDGFLPVLIPPSATEIHERRDKGSGRVWAKFQFALSDVERMTAGLRRLSEDEARGLNVPQPSFTAWWTMNPGTLQGSQRRHLRVYEVPGDDAGWLVVDPRSRLAYYWSR
ncbi:MAG TPA: hypothetical protein VFR81_04770 [Longimicrobium sp.]|nr:hypothetical protein [Longimicrobium sp.]